MRSPTRRNSQGQVVVVDDDDDDDDDDKKEEKLDVYVQVIHLLTSLLTGTCTSDGC